MKRTLEPPISTLIVDDQPDIRLLLRVIINASNNGLVVAGEAESGTDALELVDTLDPDVIVLDQMMPGMSGLDTAKAILRDRPAQRIILFSAYLDDALRAAAADAGVTSCVDKGSVADLPDAIRSAAA